MADSPGASVHSELEAQFAAAHRANVLMRGPLGTEPPWVQRPHDITYEWRRLFSEAFGTFLLVLVGAGGGMVNTVYPGSVPPDARAVAPALTVIAVIYFMGMVSGAHLNPAVTLAFTVRGNFPWRRVPMYIVSQLVGAIGAVLVLWGVFGKVDSLGATLPASGSCLWRDAIVEGLLTMGLVSVILGVSSGARNVGSNAALAVGGYITLAGLWAGPVTGASMNPVRSFAPQLVSGDWHGWWIYYAGPIAGALVAVVIAWILRGPPSEAADEAAQGALGEDASSAT